MSALEYAIRGTLIVVIVLFITAPLVFLFALSMRMWIALFEWIERKIDKLVFEFRLRKLKSQKEGIVNREI